MTVRDETYRAVGWLQPEWEIAANPGARFVAATEGEATNEAPTLVVDVARTVTLPDTLTMTATVTDGLVSSCNVVRLIWTSGTVSQERLPAG